MASDGFLAKRVNRNSYVDTESRWLRLSLKRTVDATQAEADSQMKKRGAQYKRQYDANVHVEPELVPNQLVFDKPQVTDKAIAADGMKKANLYVILLQKARSIQFIEMLQHTLVIDEYEASNKVSIHRVTGAPGMREHLIATEETPS